MLNQTNRNSNPLKAKFNESNRRKNSRIDGAIFHSRKLAIIVTKIHDDGKRLSYNPNLKKHSGHLSLKSEQSQIGGARE